MLSLDLFKSKFETQLHEGAVDSVVEQNQPEPEEKIPTNLNQFNTDDNRALVKKIWTQIQQHALEDTAGWLTLEWPNQPAATLSRNQVWTVINKIARMSTTQRNAFALSTLGDRNAFLTWMNGLKIIPRPAPKKDVPRGQQSLDLKERDQKKSSEDPKFKSTRLDRLKTQARAKHPAAASDMEAMVADFVDQQDRDQAELDRVKNVNRRQDELLKQITDLNQAQDQEIDNLEGEEARLQQNVKQIQAANAALAQKLAAMSQRRDKAEPVATPTPTVGVSIATDKIPPETTPATATGTAVAMDPRARHYAQALRKQINQLQTLIALKAPNDQSQLKQDIADLKAQLAKLQQQEPITTASQATVGGQAADVMPSVKSQSKKSDSEEEFLDLTGISDVLQPYMKSGKKSAKKKTKAKQESEFELTPEARSVESIPLKSVVQGYQVEYNPKTRRVTVSRRGQVIGSGINRLNSAKYHMTLINKIIDQAEDDKYPTDIDDRDVALPVRTATEGSVFGQQKFDTQMDLAKLKSRLTQPKPAQSAPAGTAETQPVAYQSPARLSDLQIRKQRVDNLADIKKTIEQLQARATRGGRELPPGLAADLEDYFTTADIDTDYDEMMSKYQRQLAALQKYLNLRRAVWSPKKDIQEGGPETWTVYFTDGTTTRVRVPNDETDPAQVRAFFAKKGKTVSKFDYGFGTSADTVSKPEPHEPGSGSAVSARTGDPLPEDAVDRSGSPMYKKQEAYMIVHNGRDIAFYKPSDMKQAYADAEELAKKYGGEVHVKKVMREGRAGYNPMNTEKEWHEVERYLSSMINDRTLDPETRAEARQRYLEKRKEAQQKGWAK